MPNCLFGNLTRQGRHCSGLWNDAHCHHSYVHVGCRQCVVFAYNNYGPLIAQNPYLTQH